MPRVEFINGRIVETGFAKRVERIEVNPDGTFKQDALIRSESNTGDSVPADTAAHQTYNSFQDQLNHWRSREADLRERYAALFDANGEPKKGVSYTDIKRVEIQLAEAVTQQANIVEIGQQRIAEANAQEQGVDKYADVKAEIAAHERGAALRKQDEIARRAHLPAGLRIGGTVGDDPDEAA